MAAKTGKKPVKNDNNTVACPDFNPESAIPLNALCQICGVSRRTGERLIGDGYWKACGQHGKLKLFSVSECLQAYIELQLQREREKYSASDIETLKSQKLKAEIALKDSQGELHHLKTEREKGTYISIDEVKLDYQIFGTTLKKFIEAIPARVGGQVAGYVDPLIERGIERGIEQELKDLRRQFYDSMYVEEEGGGMS